MTTQEILDQIKSLNFPDRITRCGISFQAHFRLGINLPAGTSSSEAWDIIRAIREINQFLKTYAIGCVEEGDKLSIGITWCAQGLPDDMVCHCDDCQTAEQTEP